MVATAATPTKGAATREVILARAFELASANGLEGLTIGSLADQVGMSKSGVFAHFGSREDLQLAVLELAGRRFVDAVLMPALKTRRGLPRLRAIMRNWLEWGRTTVGGCVLLGAVGEYDDRPGPLRDHVVAQQRQWRAEIAHAVQLAIDSGELEPRTDPEQMSFELYSIALIVHFDSGLFGYAPALARGQEALRRLLRAYGVADSGEAAAPDRRDS
ncbi:TetR/AcrR family transcriptional regulator [Luteimonas sp. RD2P54]|uniref:TetR/AcrR family transcriptional regulator n=1 Tax=Luteimonas endophytica TaxID=3042023 RepID=A0ABT6J3X7_9GAMM|nr:TetR/AcrR family transcriptional regulator [Luteimonas endophytica]MDH5821479.1 TetR/AcrR family transcriptional regulator [Luteimonas endophytica]